MIDIPISFWIAFGIFTAFCVIGAVCGALDGRENWERKNRSDQ